MMPYVKMVLFVILYQSMKKRKKSEEKQNGKSFFWHMEHSTCVCVCVLYIYLSIYLGGGCVREKKQDEENLQGRRRTIKETHI